MTIHKRAEDLIGTEITRSALADFCYQLAYRDIEGEVKYNLDLDLPFDRDDIMCEFERVYKIENDISDDNDDIESDIYDFIESHYSCGNLWSVSYRVAKKLKEKGEFVIESDLSGFFWLRKTFGQAVYMDEVVLEIASELIS